MKIGILTFHRAHNYGAFLQCYALQEFLRSQGHNSYVIDYDCKYVSKWYMWRDKNWERVIWRNPVKSPWRLFLYMRAKWKPMQRFFSFRKCQKKCLRLVNVDEIQENPFDLIIIGSDQVWSTTITDGIDNYYWGNFPHPKQTKIATYAVSMASEWEEIYLPQIEKRLQNLYAISVREKWVKMYMNGLFPNIPIMQHTDPVLLHNTAFWKHNAIKPKVKCKYVFFYQVNHDELAIKIAKEIAQKEQLSLYILSANVNGINSKECQCASPFEFIGWIQYADLVVTSSFHGLAFSILFNKRFYAIRLGLSSDHRLENILQIFHLENLFISKDGIIPEKYAINYHTDDILSKYRASAIEYFDKIMK